MAALSAFISPSKHITLSQRLVELVESQYVELGERYLLEAVEVAILSDYVVGSSGNGAVDKLVVILVNVTEQMKMVVRLTVERFRVARNGLNHIVCHLGRSVQAENLLILGQYLVTHAQAILALKEVCPYPMVKASRGQDLDEAIGVENYVPHGYLVLECARRC